MKIVFAGTPDFSATILKSLIKSTHDILACYTQPDRPKGRGRKLTASPVKTLAQEHGINVYQPSTLKTEEAQAELKALNPDIMVVVAYGLILPQAALDIPKHGCLNIHASLLPRWRGAAPIQRAIESGDNETGITIMQMDAGLDTGDMLLKETCAITDEDTSKSMHDKLSFLGANAVLQALNHYDELIPENQDNALVTYAEKITKQEGNIDWNATAVEIQRRIRAFNPWPSCYSNDLKIWEATVIEETSSEKPGTIIRANKEGIDVATGQDLLRILKCQLPGGKPLTSADMLNAKKEWFLPGKSL